MDWQKVRMLDWTVQSLVDCLELRAREWYDNRIGRGQKKYEHIPAVQGGVLTYSRFDTEFKQDA